MSFTLTGNPHGPYLRKTEPVYRRGVGWATRHTYEGTNVAIRAAIPLWTPDAESIELDLSGPTGTAVVVYARDVEGNPDPAVSPEAESETTWELDGNEVVKDLFEHPDVASLSQSVVATLKEQLNNFDSGVTVDLSSLSSVNQGWFALLIKGVRQFTSVQWVLRKTVTVPRTYPNQVSLTGVNQLWTPTQITGIPSSVLFDINQIEEPSNIPSAFFWSWLKKSPRVSRSSNGRFQMVEEWWLDAWSCRDETTDPITVGVYYAYEP